MLRQLRSGWNKVRWQWRGRAALQAHLILTGWECLLTSEGDPMLVRRTVRVALTSRRHAFHYFGPEGITLRSLDYNDLPNRQFWAMALHLIGEFDATG